MREEWRGEEEREEERVGEKREGEERKGERVEVGIDYVYLNKHCFTIENEQGEGKCHHQSDPELQSGGCEELVGECGQFE